MPKAISLNFEDNLEEVIRFYKGVTNKMIPTATRRSLNRAMDVQFTRFQRETRARRKLPLKTVKRFIQKRPTKEPRDINRMVAFSIAKGKKIGLIDFVVGKKEKRPQKGRTVKQRRRVRIEIKPGVRSKPQGIFIAKGKGGRNQVFRRRTVKSNPIVRQAVSGIGKLLSQPNILEPIIAQSQSAQKREYFRVLNMQMNRKKVKKRTKRR